MYHKDDPDFIEMSYDDDWDGIYPGEELDEEEEEGWRGFAQWCEEREAIWEEDGEVPF